MKQILVTGGAGFIGSNFINHMLDSHSNLKIVNFDDLTYASNIEYLTQSDNHIFVRGNILNLEDINNLFSKYEFDAIINFAAETHVDKSIVNPLIFTQTNVMGMQNLIFKAMEYDVDRFIQISTDEVYGSNEVGETFTEDSRLRPRNPYSASKASADLMLNAIENTYGYKSIIVRSSNNYGYNQYAEKLIPLSIKRLIGEGKIKLYGSGKQMRDWICVKDNVRVIEKILFKGELGNVYNICTEEEIENIEVAKKIIESVNNIMKTNYSFEDNVEFIEDRKGHDFGYTMSNNKIVKKFGYSSFIRFQDEIEKVVRYYLKYYGVL